MRLISFLFLSTILMACGGSSSSDLNNLNNDSDTTTVIDSLSFYQKKLNADPNNPAVLFERARYYIRHSEVDLAEKDLQTILAKDSSMLKAQKLFADIKLSKLDLEKSKYHYEYVIKRDSLNTGALIGMGKIYAALDNSGKALDYLNDALRINPYLAEPYFTKGLIYRSDYYVRPEEDPKKKESWKRAISSFQTAVEQDPNYYAAYVEMGVMYDEIGDSVALEYYNSALEIFPESIEAWYNKGMYYQNRGEVDNALNCYYVLNGIDETWADPYYNLGYIHLVMTNELDSAIFYFEKSTTLDPNFYQAYNNLGLAYEEMGDKKNARKYYLKAIDVNPDFQLAKDNLNALK